MKKTYMKPAMQVVKIQQQYQILAGSPDAHEELGGSGQLSRELDGWDDKDE